MTYPIILNKYDKKRLRSSFFMVNMLFSDQINECQNGLKSILYANLIEQWINKNTLNANNHFEGKKKNPKYLW